MKRFLIILPLSLLAFWAFAQIGVNTETPSQALDVNGKLEVGDDAAPATEGAIRYASQEFEGYNGSTWVPLSGGAGIPSNAVPVFGKLYTVPSTGTTVIMNFADTGGSTVVNGSVPAGKYLVVTSIELYPKSLYDIDTEDPVYSVEIRIGSQFLSAVGRYTGGPLFSKTAGYGPIGVVEPGGSVTVISYAIAGGLEYFNSGIRADITGFLVDDLNFN